ncbi:hypothetical protein HanIR_Chr06g0285271 [Helianthus annuus]|nr:hypothetical protein HanIR_Chr06g0285271 [Helianthus annuus]
MVSAASSSPCFSSRYVNLSTSVLFVKPLSVLFGFLSKSINCKHSIVGL